MKFIYLAVFLFSIFFTSLISKPANAQPLEQANQITVWGGYSFKSIRFLGKTRNSQTQIYAVGVQKRIMQLSKDRMLWYTTDIIPYVHFSYPKRDENNLRTERTGVGFSPIGFKVTEESDRFISPYLQTTGGIMYMEDYFPTDDARRLNFTFDITIGAKLDVSSLLRLSFGYKFHHISNAETGEENPGLDSNFLFFNLTFK